MNIGPEDKYASILALLTLIAQCQDGIDMSAVRQTTILTFTFVKDIKPVTKLKAT
ncbi:hypothetical protein [Budvicia aquatica]|uniref:Uncharacterized protein n=1 Tax=Budvicia aquatica TaxID=82979 RepID=A0A485A206_9GAMM|nr:hypothetical protein [Budvicia aquatica]VFS51569.1 Uncharacterised protein [Budvicia aquatica]